MGSCRMPKRSNNLKSSPAPARAVATGKSYSRDGRAESRKPAKNPAAVALGRLGGRKGGKARAAKLSPKQRSVIARKAAKSRWSSRAKP
jgi:hypothetical protein